MRRPRRPRPRCPCPRLDSRLQARLRNNTAQKQTWRIRRRLLRAAFGNAVLDRVCSTVYTDCLEVLR
jgi:hypothetical protein